MVENSKKGLVLNKINNRTIRGAYDDNTADWAGKLIVLYPTTASFGGRMVPALRVRIPVKSNPKITTGKPKAKPAVEAEDPEPESDTPDFDDDVEF